MVASLAGILASAGGALGSMLLSRQSAEHSSALQYQYQSNLNKQNYNYNKALINLQNAFNERMMDKANDYNTNAWNESVELANTAHQREIKDLKAAGLNPILSANGGASTVNPVQSAQASSGNSQLSSSAGMPTVDYVDALNTAYGMYQEDRRVKNELDNSKTQRNFVRAQELSEYNNQEINKANSASQIKKQQAEVEQIRANIQNQRKLTNAQVQNLVSQADLNRYNSARSRQETKNLENEYYHYGVDRSFSIGGKKFGLGINWTSHPNEKHSHNRRTQYEYINGRKVPVDVYL